MYQIFELRKIQSWAEDPTLIRALLVFCPKKTRRVAYIFSTSRQPQPFFVSYSYTCFLLSQSLPEVNPFPTGAGERRSTLVTMPEKFVNLIVLILVLLRIASSYTLPKRLTSPKLSWRVWRQSKKSESEVPPPSLICDLEPEQCDWECAEDASCTLVPTKSSVSPARLEQDYHKYEAEELKRGENVREKKIVRINDRWVDLTAWRLQHPAGAHWIDAFHGRDATEVVTAFHSGEAMAMVDRLPRAKAADVTAAVAAAASDVTFGQSISTTGVGVSSKSTSSSDVEFQVGARTAATAVFSVDPEGRVANAQQIKNMNRNAIKDPEASSVSSSSSKSLRDPTALSLRSEPEVSSLTRAFRKWRAELVAEGWFKRDPLWEAYQLASWAAVCGLGVLLANSGSGGWARAVISRATNHLGAFFLSGTAAAAAHSTTAVTVAAKSAGSGTGATILRTFDVTEAISRIAKVLMTVLHKASSSIAGLDPRLFPLLSVVPLAFSNSYAGWLAHDYCHGTDRFCNAMRQFGAFAAGLGTIMWGEKHNLHHARTNEVSFFLFLGSPSSFVLALNVAILLYCWLLVSIRDSTILPLIAPFFRLRVLSNALLSLCSSRQSRWAWIRTYPVVLCCLFGPLPRRTISPGGATNICTCLLPIVCSLSFGAWTASK